METSYDEILQAIDRGDIKYVKHCLKRGISINKICSNGMTLLGAAAQTGNLPMVKALIEHRASQSAADLDFTNENRSKPNFLELDLPNKKRYNNVGYFVVCRDVEENEFGEGPTPDGMEGLEWDMEVTEGEVIEEDLPAEVNIYKWYAKILNQTSVVLKSPDGDLARLDSHGQNVLHYAVRSRNGELVEYLIKSFAEININQGDSCWYTPLHMAVLAGNLNLVRLLISQGADVNAVNRQRQTALHLAAQYNFVEIIAILVENGANLNAFDIEERSPLTFAVFNLQEAAVRTLVDRGAKLNYEETNGFTVLRRAVWNNSTAIARILLEGGAKVVQSHFLLQTATRNNNLDVVRMLHRAGAVLNVRDDQGNTPLMVACSRKNLAIAKYFLRHGASPNTVNHINGMTALHVCVQDIREPKSLQLFIELLVGYGADMNAHSYQGSVLFYAIILENLRAACTLVRHGVDVNLQDERAYFDNLSLAKRHGNLELVKMIVYAGFDFANMVFDLGTLKSQQEDPIYDFLVEVKKSPMNLRELCRVCIRKRLGTNLVAKVYKLPLPNLLHRYLTLEIL